MLLAEIHGKSLDVARDKEDYLTSAVFGHLRYVPPHLFWPTLFAAAKSVPGPGGGEIAFSHVLVAAGINPAGYERLTARFWVFHPTLGEPDLLLLFTGGSQPPMAVLVEAKLWAGKSGIGKDDQLARYLGVLDGLDAVGVHLPPASGRYLIYLTPRESVTEVEDSLAQSATPDRDRERLFRLRWQDVLVAARRSAATAPEPARTVLSDVAAFLGRMGLEYFDGFVRADGLPMLLRGEGVIFRGKRATAGVMTRYPGLEPILTWRASWAT